MALGLSVIVHAACFAFMLNLGNALSRRALGRRAEPGVGHQRKLSRRRDRARSHAFEALAHAAERPRSRPRGGARGDEAERDRFRQCRGQAGRAVEGDRPPSSPPSSEGDRGGAADRGGEAGRGKEVVAGGSTLPFQAIATEVPTHRRRGDAETVEDLKAEVVEEARLTRRRTEGRRCRGRGRAPATAAAGSRFGRADGLRRTGWPGGRRSGTQSDTAGEAHISSYLGVAVAHLRRFKRYPAEAQAANVQGTARVRFSVGAKARCSRLASWRAPARSFWMRRRSPWSPVLGPSRRSRRRSGGPR